MWLTPFRQANRLIGLGVKAADLGVKAADLGVKAADLGVKATDLGVKATDLGVKAADLGVKATDLGVKATDLGVKATDLGVKASSCRAADLGSIPVLPMGIVQGLVMSVRLQWILMWATCQVPGDIGSALGLVGQVSVHRYWMRASLICNFCLSVAA